MASESMITIVYRNAECIKANRDVEASLRNFIVMDIPTHFIVNYELVEIVKDVLKSGSHAEFALKALKKFQNTMEMEKRGPVKRKIEEEDVEDIEKKLRRDHTFSVQEYLKEATTLRYEVRKLPQSPRPEDESKETRKILKARKTGRTHEDVSMLNVQHASGNQKSDFVVETKEVKRESLKIRIKIPPSFRIPVKPTVEGSLNDVTSFKKAAPVKTAPKKSMNPISEKPSASQVTSKPMTATAVQSKMDPIPAKKSTQFVEKDQIKKNMQKRWKKEAEKKAAGAAIVASNKAFLEQHREARKRQAQLDAVNGGSNGVKKARKNDYRPIF